MKEPSSSTLVLSTSMVLPSGKVCQRITQLVPLIGQRQTPTVLLCPACFAPSTVLGAVAGDAGRRWSRESIFFDVEHLPEAGRCLRAASRCAGRRSRPS